MNTLGVFMFGLGVVIQATTSLQKKPPFWKMILCLIGPFLLIFRDSALDTFDQQLFAYFLVFALLFPILFLEELLPVVSERQLLIFSLIYLFVFESAYGTSFFQSPMGIIGFGFSAWSVVNGFFRYNPPFWAKILLYVWFLFIILSVGGFYYMQDFFSFAGFGGQEVQIPSNGEMFFLGATFLYLSIYFFSLYNLIPLPSKHQSFQNRWKQWKEYVQDLGKKYHDYQMRIIETILIIVLVSGAFLLNFSFHFVTERMLVSVIFFLTAITERVHAMIWIQANVKRSNRTPKKI